MRIEGLTLPVEGPATRATARQSSPNRITRLPVREKIRPAHPLQRHFREKTRPARQKTAILGHFGLAGRTFSRLHDDHSAAGRTSSRTAAGAGDAGRKTSRTGLRNMATLKPTTPLHPKTEPKRPFRTRKGDGGFNPTRARARASRGDDGFRQPAQLAYRAWLRHPHVATSPLPRKLACNSIG